MPAPHIVPDGHLREQHNQPGGSVAALLKALPARQGEIEPTVRRALIA